MAKLSFGRLHLAEKSTCNKNPQVPTRKIDSHIGNLISKRTLAIVTAALLASILIGSLASEAFTAYAQKGPKRFGGAHPDIHIPKPDIAPKPKPFDNIKPDSATPIPSEPGAGERSIIKEKIEGIKSEGRVTTGVDPLILSNSHEMNLKEFFDFVRSFPNFLLGLL